MSIKSLFENIADAIKDKNPNITNVTPVEMPSAIRSIPSGSSTAGRVTYDNTASGLTANNVQGAIDELAGNVSAITSDLSELNSNINMINVTSEFTFKNGWSNQGSIITKVGHTIIASLSIQTQKALTKLSWDNVLDVPIKYTPQYVFFSGVTVINDGQAYGYLCVNNISGETKLRHQSFADIPKKSGSNVTIFRGQICWMY